MTAQRHPDYRERVQRNIRKTIEEHGKVFYKGLDSVSGRQLYRIECGESTPTIVTLQKIADEVGFDMIELFK
jgi:transcriptional regulator with XRE-family HTH domain